MSLHMQIKIWKLSKSSEAKQMAVIFVHIGEVITVSIMFVWLIKEIAHKNKSFHSVFLISSKLGPTKTYHLLV